MTPGRPVRVEGSGVTVVERLEVADRPLARMRGLLGRRSLPREVGLLIRPCGSVHTWFMRFAIDVVFLDGQNRVIRIAHALRPFRAAFCLGRADAVLETAAGVSEAVGLRAGDRLVSDASRNEQEFP